MYLLIAQGSQTTVKIGTALMFETKKEVFDYLCERNWSFFQDSSWAWRVFDLPRLFSFYKMTSYLQVTTLRLYEKHVDSPRLRRIDIFEDDDLQRFISEIVPPSHSETYVPVVSHE